MKDTNDEMAQHAQQESQEATKTSSKTNTPEHRWPSCISDVPEDVMVPMITAAKPAPAATEAASKDVARITESRGSILDMRLEGKAAPLTSVEARGPFVGTVPAPSSSDSSSSNSKSSRAGALTVSQPASTIPDGSSRTRNSSTPANSNNTSSSDSTSHANSNTETNSKEPIGYGIPCGEESMKSLRRHVELLIDKEMNTKTRNRLETCLDALEPETLDPQLLRVVCAKGLPEGCPALRSLYWRLLLHCLPLNASEWQEHRQRIRAAYESYKAEFIREPEAVRRLRRLQQQQGGGDSPALPKEYIGRPDAQASGPSLSAEGTRNAKMPSVSSINLAAVSDHPLSRSATSEWRGYWVDAEVFDQINKDVFRTRPELCFFALNPQQTVARQQQLHLYPPPPTRQPQPLAAPTDEVPLLVDYDLLLQQQKQQRGGSAPHAGSKPSATSSKGSGSASNDPDGSTKASTSSRRGFRLPSAFRSKKASSSPAAPASNLNEDTCSSSSRRTSNCSRRQDVPVYRSSRSSLGDVDTGRQKVHDEFSMRSSETRTRSPWLGTSVSNWIEEVQKRGVSGSSRQAADAADTLEASAAAAKAARQYKRQLSSIKMQAENKASHRSAPDLRLSSQDSAEYEIASAPSSNLTRPESAVRRPSQNASSESGVAPAVAATSDISASSSTGQVHESSSRTEEAPATSSVSLQEEGLSKLTPKETKEGEQQPWRAPAGVQDVCNMLNPRRHYDVLSRLLFIYAKVNPGLCYVQGMNEILAPIYYILMTDPTYTDYEQAEAEVFFCFSEVMQQQRDAFCKALDPTDAGVRGRLARLDELLRHKDEEIWMHLNAVGVEPQFYALRWLLLMLTQEVELPDILVLWDGFIADSGRPLPLLYYVCVSMIIWLKPALLAGDFTACMKLLQHLPSFDPKALLSSAMRLRADDLLGTYLPMRHVPLPMSFGDGRPGDGLKELDPLQASDSQQIKCFPRMANSVSTTGRSSARVDTFCSWNRLPEISATKDWLGGPRVATSSPHRGGASRNNGDGPDAALGHLKRLAGVGVEHAYKGASVVSQYLNNSGLAAGLASNITSFFSSESQSTSLVPPANAPASAAADLARHSAASTKPGNFSTSTPPTTLVTAPHAAAYNMPEATIATPVAEGAKHDVQSLEEYLFPKPEPQETDFLANTDCNMTDEAPRPRNHGAVQSDSILGQDHTALADLLDTPRNAESLPFDSPTGEGLRITIL